MSSFKQYRSLHFEIIVPVKLQKWHVLALIFGLCNKIACRCNFSIDLFGFRLSRKYNTFRLIQVEWFDFPDFDLI